MLKSGEAVLWMPELMVIDFTIINKNVRAWNSGGQIMLFNYKNKIGIIIIN